MLIDKGLLVKAYCIQMNTRIFRSSKLVRAETIEVTLCHGDTAEQKRDN